MSTPLHQGPDRQWYSEERQEKGVKVALVKYHSSQEQGFASFLSLLKNKAPPGV